jgi:hypothetical protein
MKNMESKLGKWIGLLAVCLLPMGARAADHYHLPSMGARWVEHDQSGIIGLVEEPNLWNTMEISDGRESIAVPIDADGFFGVELKPGRYVVTTYYFPVYVPGEPFPNFIAYGTPITVTVRAHRFTFVEIPELRLLPPAPNSYQPLQISVRE